MLATKSVPINKVISKWPLDARNPAMNSKLSPGKKKVGGKDSKKIIRNKIPYPKYPASSINFVKYSTESIVTCRVAFFVKNR